MVAPYTHLADQARRIFDELAQVSRTFLNGFIILEEVSVGKRVRFSKEFKLEVRSASGFGQ
jgi:hypothetical protein